MSYWLVSVANRASPIAPNQARFAKHAVYGQTRRIPLLAPCCNGRLCVTLERVTESSNTAANTANELRIAVIGAGPAGVYSSDIFLRQLKKLGDELGVGTEARIDLFEKLPVPFGLVRYGVAPDHPSI